MRFKIVTVGWRCGPWWRRTLDSVQAQSVDNWDVSIAYDSGDAAGVDLQAWCDEHGDRWQLTVNETQKFAPRNQWETIQRLAPADDDIVVFLDLDGDQLAHRDVLAHLAEYYADGTLVTYGSYAPVPPNPHTPAVKPFPPQVVAQGSYRRHILTAECCFNHLRTMKGIVARSIPENMLHWPNGPKKGQWYEAGTDYVFMVSALELAGGRYKCIPETLLLYNAANPLADNKTHPRESDACTQNFLRRAPLRPLQPR